jgi:hypothetical protein
MVSQRSVRRWLARLDRDGLAGRQGFTRLRNAIQRRDRTTLNAIEQEWSE